MKKTILILSFILILAVSAIGFSGCLGNNNMRTDDPDEIRTVSLYAENGNVVARITIFDRHFNSFDTRNISQNERGQNIDLFVPIFVTENINPNGTFEATTDVAVGEKSRFTPNQNYTLRVNDEDDHDEIITFQIQNNELISLQEARIENVSIRVDGNNVVAVARVYLRDGRQLVEDDKIRSSGGFYGDNEYTIYIPVTTREEIQGIDAVSSVNKEFIVGQLNQLRDGRYSVDINDFEIYFTVRNNTITNVNGLPM